METKPAMGFTPLARRVVSIALRLPQKMSRPTRFADRLELIVMLGGSDQRQRANLKPVPPPSVKHRSKTAAAVRRRLGDRHGCFDGRQSRAGLGKDRGRVSRRTVAA